MARQHPCMCAALATRPGHLTCSSMIRGINKFTCMLQTDCLVTIDGDSSLPAATASLESIGHLGPDQNIRIAELLSAVIHNELGVTPGRFVLTFYDLSPHNIAKKGTTVAVLER
ncbi:uncharacterized protein LOC112056751 isoform X2 [Bicyclus anynana]|uniref:L-dopachrome isomerase n=1 Tax=Bicyclus anynana TaxID=110368 RepID=A0ABM3M6W3_BICAN|nr:uncharacterized protein LOC112056751 isoform X2 [Bicyclus anynana]